MSYLCGICNSGHASANALRVHRHRVHSTSSAGTSPHRNDDPFHRREVNPPARSSSQTPGYDSIAQISLSTSNDLPKIVLVENARTRSIDNILRSFWEREVKEEIKGARLARINVSRLENELRIRRLKDVLEQN